MPQPDQARLTRRQRELLRDLDVAGRLKDIRDAEDLRDQLAPKWWETAVGLLQFSATLGFLAALLQHPQLRSDRLTQLLIFFFIVMVLSLVLGFEFLIFKLHHLRRAHTLAQRRIQSLEQRLDRLAQSEHGNEPSPAVEVAGDK